MTGTSLHARLSRLVTIATAASHEKSTSRPTFSEQTSRKRRVESLTTLVRIQVRYSRRCRYIQVQRFIVGVLRNQPKKVTVWMLLALYDNQLNLERLALRDPTFRKKFGKALEALSTVLSEVKVDLGKPQRAINQFHSRLQALDDFALPERNWKDISPRIHNWVWLEVKSNDGIEKCQLPPRKVIGKGYSDKGSARKLYQDGSPRWQELALADLELVKALNQLRLLVKK